MHIKITLDHKKQLFRIIMAVPDKLSFNAIELYMVIVKRGYVYRFTRLINKLQFCGIEIGLMSVLRMRIAG